MAEMTPGAAFLQTSFYDPNMDTAWTGEVGIAKGMPSLANPPLLVDNFQLDQPLPPDTVDWTHPTATMAAWNHPAATEFPLDPRRMGPLEEPDATPSSELLGQQMPNTLHAALEAQAQAQVQPPRRKRGRPRKIREDPPVPTMPKPPRGRQPHTEVEKKYRNSLNNGMERLRRALPHAKQEVEREEDCVCQVRLSKLGVLLSAAEWLERWKTEITTAHRDIESLKAENEALRSQLSSEMPSDLVSD